MMRRCLAFTMFVLLTVAPLRLADAQFSDLSDTMSFEGVVNSIVAWISNNQDATTPTGITDWDNSNLATSATDSVAIFRLVANVDVTLTATAQGILSQTIGADTAVLATYYQIASDGDGSSTTGFLGTETGDGIGSVCSGPQKLGTNSSVVTKTPQLPP